VLPVRRNGLEGGVRAELRPERAIQRLAGRQVGLDVRLLGEYGGSQRGIGASSRAIAIDQCLVLDDVPQQAADWAQVVRAAHFGVSDCQLGVDGRQQLEHHEAQWQREQQANEDELAGVAQPVHQADGWLERPTHDRD